MRGKAGPHYGPPHVKAKHVISVCRPTTAILVQVSMTKGLNSPDAKRPRGGRSPVPEDADMTDKPQLRIPEARGAGPWAAEVVAVATATRRLGRPLVAESLL